MNSLPSAHWTDPRRFSPAGLAAEGRRRAAMSAARAARRRARYAAELAEARAIARQIRARRAHD